MRESDLYPPLKTYLEAQGYRVHSEVRGCDLVARREDELIVVELKSSFSLALLAQAVERKELTDSVYVAVPVPEGKRLPANYRRTKGLLRRLELGCILIDLLKTKRKIHITLHPEPFTGRKSPKRRRALLREIDGRYAEFDLAGQASTRERITAYKQQAILIALLLAAHGPLSPKQLRELGASDRSQPILSANVYGWFERQRRGIYAINASGHEALEHYRDVAESISRSLPLRAGGPG
jgi:hypothetical protein